MSGTYVRVRVGAETYALPIEHVVEVSELGNVTSVPGALGPAVGVRNLRGEVLPVFDLAAVLGLTTDGPPTRLLVAEDGAQRAGLAIADVMDVGPLPEGIQDSDSDLLTGSTLDDGTLIGVVDVPRLFDALSREAA